MLQPADFSLVRERALLILSITTAKTLKCVNLIIRGTIIMIYRICSSFLHSLCNERPKENLQQKMHLILLE